jgi:hypothetical protein
MPDGIWPMRELERNPRFCSDVNVLIDRGIDPERWLASRYIVVNEFIPLMLDGIVPTSLLPASEKYPNDVNAPMEEGIEPVKELL